MNRPVGRDYNEPVRFVVDAFSGTDGPVNGSVSRDYTERVRCVVDVVVKGLVHDVFETPASRSGNE